VRSPDGYVEHMQPMAHTVSCGFLAINMGTLEVLKYFLANVNIKDLIYR